MGMNQADPIDEQQRFPGQLLPDVERRYQLPGISDKISRRFIERSRMISIFR